MNIDNWTPVFKTNYYTKQKVETNLVYTPLINREGNIYCMNFDHLHPYQNELVSSFLPQRPHYTKELVRYFFEREKHYISKFSSYSWAPEYCEIDDANQRIFFKFSGSSCNTVVTQQADAIDHILPNWQQQLTAMVDNIISAGYLKMTLYPHCCFYDGTLKTFDFYGCVDRADPHISMDVLRGIIGVISADRFASATDNNLVNMRELFIQTLTKHHCWPTNALEKFVTVI